MIHPNDSQIIDVDKDQVEPAITVRTTSKKETSENAEKKTLGKNDNEEDSRDDNVKEVTASSSQDRENPISEDFSSVNMMTKRPLDIACAEATMPANND